MLDRKAASVRVWLGGSCRSLRHNLEETLCSPKVVMGDYPRLDAQNVCPHALLASLMSQGRFCPISML